MSVAEGNLWSLRPEALELVREAIDGGRRRIVECGSGAGTILIGRMLAARGNGRLHSLEHDPHWAEQARARIDAEKLAARVTVVEAPLRPHPLAGECGWYDGAALAALPARIDLLLVDGPPGALAPDGETRYPALPALAGRLADGALVMLDDIDRAGERRVLERWRGELGIEFELRPEARVAIGVFCGPDPVPAPGNDTEGK
jgi:predicted O-methyltransferase YrrM